MHEVIITYKLHSLTETIILIIGKQHYYNYTGVLPCWYSALIVQLQFKHKASKCGMECGGHTIGMLGLLLLHNVKQ